MKNHLNTYIVSGLDLHGGFKMKPLIQLEHVKKEYTMGNMKISACEDISFDINKGEFVMIVGPSGAGKTTVLNLLGGMDQVSSGQITVDNHAIHLYNKKQLTTYRRNDIGFVFQFYNLIPNLTALENIELASQIRKNSLKPKKVLEDVGLSHRMNNFPAQLSGGEQQRVSIARALAKNPKILLCDEPTGALDDETGKSILKLLKKTNQDRQMTTIVITHNHLLTPIADRVIQIRSGRVISNTVNEYPVSVEEIE